MSCFQQYLRSSWSFLACFALVALWAAPRAGAEIFPLDAPRPITDASGGFQVCPTIDAGDGGYAVGWQSTASSQDFTALRSRRFDLRGLPQTPVARHGQIPTRTPGCSNLAVTPEPEGRSLVAWNESSMPNPFTIEYAIQARAVDASGDGPPATPISPEESRPGSVDVASLPDGRSLAVWPTDSGADLLTVQPLTPAAQTLPGSTVPGALEAPQVEALEGGFFVAVGRGETAVFPSDPRPTAGRLFTADGTALGGEFPVHDAPVRIDALAGGGFVAVWAEDGDVVYRLFEADGTPRGQAVRIPVAGLADPLPGAEVDEPDVASVRRAAGGPGGLVLAWRERVGGDENVSANRLRALAVELDGTPVGPPVRLDADRSSVDPPAVVSGPRVDSAAPGTFLATWSSDCDGFCSDGELPDPVTLVRPMAVTPGPAAASAGDRFEISVTWTAPDGSSGVGVPVELTDDTVSFWFFRPSNVELVVKVLDGRPVNGNFWVFGGALTTVEYTVTVHDTEADRTFTHHNPQGNLDSFADTTAFPGS